MDKSRLSRQIRMKPRGEWAQFAGGQPARQRAGPKIGAERGEFSALAQGAGNREMFARPDLTANPDRFFWGLKRHG